MLPSRRFVFLRHGQTDWNVQSRIQGHTDIPLNPTGIEQAQAAAVRLANCGIDGIVSSPLQRAFKTAQIVGEALRLPVGVDADLKERPFGIFEGRIIGDVKREQGISRDQPLSSVLPPDAETWPQTCARTLVVVAKWLTETPPDQTLLFVSHDGLFRALHEQLIGTRPGATHATPYLFAPAGGDAWSVCELG
jgi:broad specificity phosphatase PhoE